MNTINPALTPRPVRGPLALEQLQLLTLLAALLCVAKVLFATGLTKLRDWETALALFENEYVVPVLLALDWARRFAAADLSMVNTVAVISLAEIVLVILAQHRLWGALLAVLLFCGGRALV